MNLQPAISLSAPVLVAAAAALSLQPVCTIAPGLVSAHAVALCFAARPAQVLQAVPALQLPGLRFGGGASAATTSDMLVAIKGDPGAKGDPGDPGPKGDSVMAWNSTNW